MHERCHVWPCHPDHLAPGHGFTRSLEFPDESQAFPYGSSATPNGLPIAFPVADTRRALEAGEDVVVEGITAMLDGDGIRVVGSEGELPAHQAFWFAWSQFHPATVVWTMLG